MPTELKAHTYLFNAEPRAYPYSRDNSRTVRLVLPNLVSEEEYVLPYDERDRRALVVFDGDMPWNGLPRNGAVVQRDLLGIVPVGTVHVRKRRTFEEEPPKNLSFADPSEAHLALQRWFLLLPGGAALVRRYRPESLAGQYALVEVMHRAAGAIVTWRNSSY